MENAEHATTIPIESVRSGAADPSAQHAMASYPFSAFLSYSHASDALLSAALQEWIEVIDKAPFRGRARRVFRDNSTLSMSESLWGAIEAKLDQASFLLILASPSSARSPWVAREIAYFLRKHGRSRIGIAISSGRNPWNVGEWEEGIVAPHHPDCAVSPHVFQMFGGLENPPLFVDLRAFHGLRKGKLGQFGRAMPKPLVGTVMSIVAAIESRDKDELFGAHLGRERTARRTVTAVALSFSLLAAVALSLWYMEVRAEGKATAEADKAMKAANEATLRLQQSLFEAGRAALLGGRPLDAATYLSDVYGTTIAGDELFKMPTRVLLGRAMNTVNGALFDVGAPVTAFVLTTNDEYAVAGDASGHVSIWHLGTGKRARRWKAHEGEVLALAFSPDGRTLATGGTDKLAKLWDFSSARLKSEHPGHLGAVGAIVYNDNGEQFATATGQYLADEPAEPDPTVHLWEASTGKLLRRFELPRPPPPDREPPQVTSVAFSPNGATIAAVGDHAFALWDVRTGRPITTDFGAREALPAVAFHPSGRFLVVAGATQHASDASGPWIRDAKTGKALTNLSASGGLRSFVRFDRGGQRFATSGPENDATIWRFESGSFSPLVLEGHDMPVTDLAFSTDGLFAVTASLDRRVRVWHARSGTLLSTFEGHNESIEELRMVRDGTRIISASTDRSLRAWDTRQIDTLVLRGQRGTIVSSVAFSPEGKRLLALPNEGPARLWDLDTRRVLCDLPVDVMAGAAAFDAVAFSRSFERPLIATWRADGVIAVWSASDCSLVRSLGQTRPRDPDEPDRRLAFDDAATVLVATGEAGTAYVWPLASTPAAYAWPLSGAQAIPLAHGSSIVWLDVSGDGSLALTAGDDGAVKVWDLEDGSLRFALKTSDNDVLEARFSPAGDTIITLGADESVAKLWDTQTGSLRARFPVRGEVLTASFSRDGLLLSVSTSDGRSNAWRVEDQVKTSSVDDLQGIVIANAFLGDTRLVASSTVEGGVRLWDSSSGTTLAQLKLPRVALVQPSPAGDFIALPGLVGDGDLLVLRTAPEQRDPARVRDLIRCIGRRRLENERPMPHDSAEPCE